MLVLLDRARRESRKTLAMECRYRLFAIRDELRAHVIQHPELTKQWVFHYLDSTITKFVSQLPNLSLWHMSALVLTYGKDQEFETHRKHLEIEYAKPENRKFKVVEVELMSAVGQYLSKKHSGAAFMFRGLLACGRSVSLVRKWAIVLRKERTRSLEVMVEAPETSTLRDYCPA